MSNANNPPPEKQQTLWCLPYDTETFFKQFLKISFTKFLKQLVSNKYFPLYEKQMAKQIYDRNLWGDKCWYLLQFFQFLNQSFQISELDIIVNFIEEEMLRKVIGHFRLWIDLERLYLFNFLKLDRMEFMDDRIFMSLYRTLQFTYTLFSQYDYDDFHPEFIKEFCRKSIILIQQMTEYFSKPIKALADAIKTVFINFSQKKGNLINNESLGMFKREVKIKIVQLGENIKDVEFRLYNNVKYQQKMNQQNKMKGILQMSFIDSLTKQIELLVDPKKKIIEDYKMEMLESGLKQDPKQIQTRLKNYQEQLKQQRAKQTLYESLQKTNHDPYEDLNAGVYGGLISIDMSKKQELQAKKIQQVIERKENDEYKIYYQPQYVEKVQKIKPNSSKVTYRDLARNGTADLRNSPDKNTNQLNKVYNLRYTYLNDQNRTPRPSNSFFNQRDFDNNILFKNEIDQFIENSKQEMIHRMAAKDCQTKTFFEIKNKTDKLFPKDMMYSFGSDLYSTKQPLFFSVNKLKTLNRNKFDEMRKIISYMTAQKKIKNLILQKTVPQQYPRNFHDIKTLCYNPLLFQQKVNYCNGKSKELPQII